jgi:hypothetical protein
MAVEDIQKLIGTMGIKGAVNEDTSGCLHVSLQEETGMVHDMVDRAMKAKGYMFIHEYVHDENPIKKARTSTHAYVKKQ